MMRGRGFTMSWCDERETNAGAVALKTNQQPEVVLVVSRRCVSLNELMRRYRHPLAYARLKRAWAHDLLYGNLPAVRTLRSRPGGSLPLVRFVREYSGRELSFDSDNLVGGLKPVRDALVDLEIIAGDSGRDATFEYEQRRIPGRAESRLVVTVSV